MQLSIERLLKQPEADVVVEGYEPAHDQKGFSEQRRQDLADITTLNATSKTQFLYHWPSELLARPSGNEKRSQCGRMVEQLSLDISKYGDYSRFLS